MDSNGKISATNLPCYPAHWDDTPTTPSSQGPEPLTPAHLAVALGKPPPGYVPLPKALVDHVPPTGSPLKVS
jgi:hypothetical protein